MFNEIAKRWWMYPLIFIVVLVGSFFLIKHSVFVRNLLASTPLAPQGATTSIPGPEAKPSRFPEPTNAGQQMATERYDEFRTKYPTFWGRDLLQCTKDSNTLYGASLIESGYGDGELYLFASSGAEVYYRLCGLLPSDGCDVLEERGSRTNLEEYACERVN